METQINDSIFNTFPKLISERLIFRAYQLKDAQALLKIRSHPDVSKYMDTSIPKCVEDTETRIDGYEKVFQKKTGITWAIIEKSSEQLIGDFGIWHIDKKNARGDIGYILHPEYWRKGYMSETISTLIPFGFNHLNLHSYSANVNIENKNSKALLLKFGFKLEAYFRENFYYDGQFLDSEIYCLIKSDVN